MGDDKRGTTPHELGECIANYVFALCIEGAGGFVEQENAWVSNSRSGDGHTLLLPAAQSHPTLSDECRHAVGEILCERVDVCERCSRFHRLVCCIGETIANVLRNGHGKQRRLLRHNPESTPERRWIQIAQVLAVECDTTPRHVVESKEEADTGGFAPTTRSHKSSNLPRRNSKTHSLQDRNVRSCGVAEVHVVEADLATHNQLSVAAFERKLWRAVCEGEHPS
mmetsp:Transcript_56764/g.123379  ORF Transcript_56764/g.123379 Transcript_56764/m.123379 type:complete len:224 (-) Transcript_56764:988-1659(-)